MIGRRVSSTPPPAALLAEELRVACRLAREAGRAIEAIRAEGYTTTWKRDDSPVTRADLASERLVREGLLAAFPEDGILSEETAGIIRGRSGRTWIVDPLDGTQGFVAGQSGYAVQIGLLIGGDVVLGVFLEPHDDRLYRAVRGGGAFLETPGSPALRLHVSDRREYPEMPLVTSSSMPGEMRARLTEALALPDGGSIRSVGAKVGAVVRGAADVYVSEHPVNLWDSAGPKVVLEEAGGVVTHPDLRPMTYDLSASSRRHRGPFLATNGTRHEDLCRDVSRLLGW